MKTRSFYLVIAVMLVMFFPVSCHNGGERLGGVRKKKENHSILLTALSTLRGPKTGCARCINICFNTLIL